MFKAQIQTDDTKINEVIDNSLYKCWWLGLYVWFIVHFVFLTFPNCAKIMYFPNHKGPGSIPIVMKKNTDDLVTLTVTFNLHF